MLINTIDSQSLIRPLSPQNSNPLHPHRKSQWLVRLLTPLMLVAVLVSNQLQGTTRNKTTSDKFHLWVTPPGMFFTIWAVIYTCVGITVVYNLIKNVWSLKAHFWFFMSNVFSIFWTFVFDHGELWTTVFASVIILCLALSVLFLWTELGHVQKQNINPWTYFMRNTFALYLGWVIAASNINLGMDIVYLFGASKQTQMTIFWVMTPLCALAGFALNVWREGKFGLLSCVVLWLSVTWAFVGAGITSYGCSHGTETFC